MAFWNPFGWSEEDRMAIQSIVRPITQVASLASSLGVSFAGKGATDTVAGTTDAAAAADADFDQPSTLIPEPGDMGTMKEWTTDQGINDPAVVITPEQQAGMQGIFNPDATGGQQPFDPNAAIIDSGAGQIPQAEINQDWNMNPDFNPTDGSTFPGGEAGLVDPTGEQPIHRLDVIEHDSNLRDNVGGQLPDGPIDHKAYHGDPNDMEAFKRWQQERNQFNDPNIPDHDEGGIIGTEVGSDIPNTAQDQAAAVQPTDPNNTPQSNEQVGADKTTTEKDPRGPGGKKDEDFTIKDLFKNFSWENLNKFLDTEEGRKFFLEWGAKFTKMSGGAEPDRKKLTKKQIADIKKKVKEKYGR